MYRKQCFKPERPRLIQGSSAETMAPPSPESSMLKLSTATLHTAVGRSPSKEGYPGVDQLIKQGEEGKESQIFLTTFLLSGMVEG